eukprot:TRINITY_DN22647_c0_g1_i1.p1 TRINITY_DN22647_c0_g1~~TRINITY_DN22647_c0_g1_i1.p1  ORF type:complete len:825 (-),score=169.82 TRINITY_DN22647_c0_g1_i1:82-2556(-)
MQQSVSAPCLPRPSTGLLSQTAVEVMASSANRGSAWRSARGASPGVTKQDAGFDSTIHPAYATTARFHGGGASSSTSRQDGRPSTVARRENKRKEDFRVRLEQQGVALRSSRSFGGNAPRKTSGGPPLGLEGGDSVDALAESFRNDLTGLTSRLDDLAKNFRGAQKMGEEERKARQREEENRRFEAEKRLARKREQAARDPKKKVALRLENRRRFDDEETLDTVPMCNVEINCESGGRAKVKLVDVQLIRSKCANIDGGATVQTLLQLAERKEQGSGLCKKQHTTASAPVLGQDKSGMSYEDRRKMAQSKKQVASMGNLLERMCKMRSAVPADTSLGFEGLENALKKDEASPIKENLKSWDKMFMELGDKIGQQSGTDAVSPKETPLAKKLRRLSAVTGHEFTVKAQADGSMNDKRNCRDKLANEGEMREAIRRRRIRAAWAACRAVTQWMRVFGLVKFRNKQMDCIKVTLRELGEWARIRMAMTKVQKSVRFLQETCREFLERKISRCQKIAKDWQRFEDRNLERFFHRYAQQLVKEQMQEAENSDNKSIKAKQRSEAFYKELLQAVQDGEFAINWRAFRIPAKERAQVISAYYVGQLRTKIRTSSGIFDTTKEMLREHRDLQGFLREFGATLSAEEGRKYLNMKPVQMKSCTGKFWDVSEETALQLISLGAHLMRAKGVEPFQDHPALKDLPGNDMYWQPPLDLKQVATEQGVNQLDRAVVRIMQRTSLRRIIAPQAQDAGKNSSSASGGAVAIVEAESDEEDMMQDLSVSRSELMARKKKKKGDLEDIFKGFTPRLRQIREEQILEYRASANKMTESDEFS